MAEGAAQAGPEGAAPAEEVVELHYSTWGSYGQYSRTLAILRDGSVVDPSTVGRYAPGKGARVKKTIKVGEEEVAVEIVNESSRKNAHYRVRIPARAVLAVVSDAATSSGWKGFHIVRGEGEVVAEEREEKGEDEKYVYTRHVVTYYYVNAGVKVPLKEVVVSTERTLKGRPAVKVAVDGDRIVVRGDTFYVRDALRQLRFVWSALEKCWYKRVQGDADAEVQRVVEALKPLAEVEVEQR